MTEQKHIPEMSGGGQVFEYTKCGLMPTEEGHDGCLGTLKGNIMNACCGHGDDRLVYIQYWDGSDIRGDDTVKEQKKVIRRYK